LSAVSLYSFDKKFEKKITSSIINNDWRFDVTKQITTDPSHLIFTLDGDNLETESGLLGILKIGDKCPEKLASLIDNYGELGYIGQKHLR